MMKSCLILLACVSGMYSLRIGTTATSRTKKAPGADINIKAQAPGVDINIKADTITLRDYLGANINVNIALVPQFNNQHAVFAVMTALREANLMKRVSGIASISGGTLPAVFAAANVSFPEFSEVFPKNGWAGFGPSEPKISEDYVAFLASKLPATFDKLQIPVTISLTQWASEDHLKKLNPDNAASMILSSGDLYTPMLAAVCAGKPDSQYNPIGFHPKTVMGKFPVTDGGYADEWGTKGLLQLPKAARELHIMFVDYTDQWDAQTPEEVPTHPAELITMTVLQPPTASHSFYLDASGQKEVTMRSAGQWNQMMYDTTYARFIKMLDEPIEMKVSASGSYKHGRVHLDGGIAMQETFTEKAYDLFEGGARTLWWKRYMGKKALGMAGSLA